MNLSSQKNEQGYIALMSALILSIILVGLTFTVSASGFFTRFNVLDSEYKRVSLGLAESCSNAALLKIGQNYNYAPAAGGDTITIGSQSCLIQSVAYGPPDPVTSIKIATINTLASYQGSFSSMQIKSSVQNPTITPIVPATLVGSVVVSQFLAGDSLSSFHLTLDGSAINSGQQNSFSTSGTHTLSVTAPPGYTTAGWAGAPECTSGGSIAVALGNNYSCYINYTITPTTAKLTVLANISPSGPSSTITIKKNPSGTPQTVTNNTPVDVEAGFSYTVTATTPSGYQASAWSPSPGCTNGVTGTLAANTSYACVINFTLPNTSCADTVMMLDRTGSMSGSDLTGEKAAANGLLNLYSPLTPAPKTAVGVFGAVGASEPYYASIVQGLTTDYTSLHNAVNNGLNSSGGYTNLQSAIDKAQAELASLNDGKQKVLILLSDGGTNRPGCNGSGTCSTSLNAATASANSAKAANTQIYTIHFGSAGPNGTHADQDYLATLANNSANDHFLNSDTGLLSPSSEAQEATGNKWSTPSSAYADGGGAATDTGGHKHRFYNFNIPSLTGSGILGVEIKADAWASGSAASFVAPFASTFSDDSSIGSVAWASPVNAKTSDSNFATAVLGSNQDSHYIRATNFGFNIPVGSVITGITANVTRKASVSNRISDNSVKLIKAGAAASSDKAISGTWGTSDTTQAYGSSNDLWGTTWTAADINNSNFGLAFSAKRSNNSGTNTASVDYITITVNYNTPVNPACNLAVDLSWNGGTTWTTGMGADAGVKTTTLTGTETTYTFGGADKKWGRNSWASGDFTNSNFRVRVQDIDPDPGSNLQCSDTAITNLDWLQARVYYVSNTIDVPAENADGDNFYISPTATDMTQIFKNIGTKVCPAVAASSMASLNVTAAMVNSNGRTRGPNDFPVTVKDLNNNTLAPNTTSVSSDGKSKTYSYLSFSPGTVTINQPNTYPAEYYSPQYISCPSSVAAGQTSYCNIVNYDKPLPPTAPPPPPPPAPIDIGSWQENP